MRITITISKTGKVKQKMGKSLKYAALLKAKMSYLDKNNNEYLVSGF